MISARVLLEQLQAQGVTHAVGLPDNSTAALFRLLAEDDAIRLISVTREGEAFAIAAGLWIGGARPIVVIQNTGFFESGDAIRGCAIRMRVPLVCFVSYRGYSKMQRAGLAPSPDLLTPAMLSRPDHDSCALLFEPTLQAWGIPYDIFTDTPDLLRLAGAFEHALNLESPVAVLIGEDTD